MANILSVKFKYLLQLGVVNLSTNAFKIILMDPSFTFSEDLDDTYADVIASELPTANGYTIGGQLLSGVTVTESEAENISTVQFNPVSWVVSGGSISTGGAIIYDDTITSPVVDPIVGYVDFGGTSTIEQYGTIVVANIKLIQR